MKIVIEKEEMVAAGTRLGALAVLSVVFGYLLFNWVMAAAIHSRGESVVPDLKGKSLFEALRVASQSQLGIKMISEEFAEDLPAGTIVRQMPQPGITVREGKIIRVTVSQGGEAVFVPEFIGQNVNTARITLRSSGLGLGEERSRYSVVVPKGNVISQDPLPSAIVERESFVNLIVSAGPPPESVVLIPEWAGKDISVVQQWAQEHTALSVNIVVKQEQSDNYAAGTVIRQQPLPDTEIQQGTVVTVTIAATSGDEPIVGQRLKYQVPGTGGQKNIRLMIIDKNGEHEVFNGARPAGSEVEVVVNPDGPARLRAFVDGMLIEERDVE